MSGPGFGVRVWPQFWAPVSQESSLVGDAGVASRECAFTLVVSCQKNVGNAGVGVISMRGALVSLPTFATAQFKRFFDCRRAVRCMLPLGSGRFMHLVVLYGYQGVDTDAEQVALTEQLFDAALGELGGGGSGAAMFDRWGFQRGAHQNPLLGKRDFGWALG